MDLVARLRAGDGGFLLYGITPPKASTGPDDLRRIADATSGRLRSLDPDGVILYDIFDEQDRNPAERPFPFLATVDPGTYLTDQLSGWTKPAVVYRAVGKYTEADHRDWMVRQPTDRVATVLVGASSRDQPGLTSLTRAHELRRELRPDLVTGAVAIPERHTDRGDEHLRMLDKQDAGCAFFVSQVLYNADAAKNLVSDYRDECDARGVEPRPIVWTLSVCGSLRTLEFLDWLGVHVPRWMQRDLHRSEDTLAASMTHARVVGLDVITYCQRLGIPVAVNVESVSTRRVEIEAAIQLATTVRSVLED